MSSTLEDRIVATASLIADRSIFRMPRCERDFLLAGMRARLLADHKMSFVAHWGIGGSACPGLSEKDALAFQKQWVRRLGELLGCTVSIHYLLTDTHALINDIPSTLISSYSKTMTSALLDEGYSCEPLSVLLGRSQLVARSGESHCITETHWNSLPSTLACELERLAGIRTQKTSPHSLAVAYYEANLLESAVITNMFASSLFLTYQHPQMGPLLPALPRLHTFVGLSGLSRRPWFTTEKLS